MGIPVLKPGEKFSILVKTNNSKKVCLRTAYFSNLLNTIIATEDILIQLQVPYFIPFR